MGHARFAPSAMSRWSSCTASATIDVSRLYQKPAGFAAEIGTALHEVSEAVLRGETTPSQAIRKKWNGLKVTREQVDTHVVPYVKHCKSIMDEADYVGIEERSIITDEFWGTADFVAVVGTTLFVRDLKTGRAKVSPVDNLQLKTYATGVYNDLSMIHDIELIDLGIVQPGINNIASVEVTPDVIEEHYEFALDTIANIEKGKVTFVPSDSNCRFCPAAALCPAMHERALDVSRSEFDLVSLAQKMELVPILETFVSEVKEQTTQALADGQRVEGWKLGKGRMTRSWNAEEEDLVEEFKARRIPRRVYMDEKIRSVAQISKELGDDADEKLQGLVATTEGKPSLIRNVGGRVDAVDEFSDANEE